MYKDKEAHLYWIIPIVIYVLLSILEWIIHRYIMHSPNTSLGKYHILHHKATNVQTMAITHDIRLGKTQNLCMDEYTIYAVSSILPIYIVAIMQITKNKKIIFYSLTIFAILMLFHILMWNSIHSYMHNEDASKRCKLYISRDKIKQMRNYGYVKWMINNHVTHHVRKGDNKGNYNIVFPGADYIFGTNYHI